MRDQQFVHLHVHSHYSMAEGSSTIRQIVDNAIKEGFPGMALTDIGNMFGVMEFIEYVQRINCGREERGEKAFKPIVGCELYVAKHGSKEQKNGVNDMKGYHLTVLAKSLIGYKNLTKIVSNAWTEGFYASPRTDRNDLEKYHEGLIVLSSGVGSEVYAHIQKENMTALDEAIGWYKRVFGGDFYWELNDNVSMEIFNKVEMYDIRHEPIMPPFKIPDGFVSDDSYLEHLTFQKAKLIYGDPIPEEVGDRLRFELEVIEKNNAARYFLFMQDVVCTAEKELGALVGPGRGSTAGSLVAFCLGITKIDPLKHDLLFERFMCPDKYVFPDIDLDFDEEGRNHIIEWLEKKYGKECCAHVVCFSKNTMDMGVHACGYVVCDGPITDWAPICVLDNHDKEDETVRCTQYDSWHVESTGLVQLDFIGSRVLSQQKAICDSIKSMKGIDIDLNKIPLDDSKTFELFQKGDTEGVFCFDITDMQLWLRYLQPTKFNDLVILNVMFRPGLEDYIPQMLQRRSGKEKIEYPIPAMERYLQETFGMVIYQEQIMLLSRLIANFTRRDSDNLRKALGRKNQKLLAALKPWFFDGGLANGYKEDTLEKIWKDWQDIGMYLTNKAHAVSYSLLGYQMAYLKANYPVEFEEIMKEQS